MLKSEFEEMIGKQVTYDTFQMYDNVYNALPENINKQQFVDMLNIDAIPEDPEAIERRKKRKEFIDDIKYQIAGKRAEIKYFEQENERYRRYIEEEESKEFIREATALSQAETLCRSMLEEHDKKEIEFFKCVKAGLCKVAGKGGITSNEINARIMKILEQAIEQDGVFNIFEKSGQGNPEISILSDDYMAQIRNMKHKNIAAEMLRKLLEDNIKVFSRTGVVKSQLFSEKMKNVMKRYNNRMVTSAEVIEELLNLSKEMTEAYAAGKEKGLSTEELAFYDALVADPEVLRNMEDKILVEMAHELTDLIRRSRTVDWDKKQSARAYMRTQVKHLLRKYKYPPEKAKNAIEIVIKQAELMSANMSA